jgi:hypothetical protein
MRSHQDDARTSRPHAPVTREDDGVADVANRALADRRPDVLSPSAVGHLQRAAGNASVSAFVAPEAQASSPVLDVVGSGGGQPLDSATRQDMEARLGHDFSDVRVHTDDRASQSAKSVQATAYTVGSDVVFQSGAYSPQSESGRHTLAHELTHVVQQRSGPVDGTPTGDGVAVSHPSDQFEQAAERTADLVTSPSPTPAAGASVQREAEGDDTAAGEPLVQRQEMPEEEEQEEAPPG